MKIEIEIIACTADYVAEMAAIMGALGGAFGLKVQKNAAEASAPVDHYMVKLDGKVFGEYWSATEGVLALAEHLGAHDPKAYLKDTKKVWMPIVGPDFFTDGQREFTLAEFKRWVKDTRKADSRS